MSSNTRCTSFSDPCGCAAAVRRGAPLPATEVLVASGRPARDRQRGSVTAEFGVALPAFVLVLALGLGAVAAATAQLRCVDAARAGARAVARGETVAAAIAAARAAAAGGAHGICPRRWQAG